MKYFIYSYHADCFIINNTSTFEDAYTVNRRHKGATLQMNDCIAIIGPKQVVQRRLEIRDDVRAA
jgi:hypothetical protein